MIRSDQILKTVSMIQNENLDVRTVTLGVNLLDCRHRDVDTLCARIVDKIERVAGRLVQTCEDMSVRYGVPVVNKRLAVTPMADVGAGLDAEGFVALARALEQAANSVGVDLIGGFTAHVEKGASRGDLTLIEALPDSRRRRRSVPPSMWPAPAPVSIWMSSDVWERRFGNWPTGAPSATASPAPSWWFLPTSPRTTRSWPVRCMDTGNPRR